MERDTWLTEAYKCFQILEWLLLKCEGSLLMKSAITLTERLCLLQFVTMFYYLLTNAIVGCSVTEEHLRINMTKFVLLFITAGVETCDVVQQGFKWVTTVRGETQLL